MHLRCVKLGEYGSSVSISGRNRVIIEFMLDQLFKVIIKILFSPRFLSNWPWYLIWQGSKNGQFWAVFLSFFTQIFKLIKVQYISIVLSNFEQFLGFLSKIRIFSVLVSPPPHPMHGLNMLRHVSGLLWLVAAGSVSASVQDTKKEYSQFMTVVDGMDAIERFSRACPGKII